MPPASALPAKPWPSIAGAGLLGLVLVGCGDVNVLVDTGFDVTREPPDAVDMRGSWSLTLNPEDPPRVFECTGNLPPQGFGFCDAFVVTLDQNGEFFDSGPADDPNARFCDSRFQMTGVATIREISGVIARERSRFDSPAELQDLQFQAGVIGNSGTFALSRLTVRGSAGECLLGGSYVGARAGSP